MLGRLIDEAGRAYGAAPALVHPRRTVSYRELAEWSDRVAVGLRARGVSPGDVVALTLPSSPAYVVAAAAAVKIGAIYCGVNPRLSEEQRARALDLLSPAYVIEDDALPSADGDVGVLESDPERVVALVLTSGTTGEPRAATFTEREIAAIESMDTEAEAPPAGTAMMASTEFAHIGFATKMWWHLRAGMTIHMLQRWRPRDALEMVSQERISAVGGIAPQIALMLRVPDFDAFDLSHVRLIIAGGAASPAALIEEARARFGAAYSVRYSSTELGGLGTLTAIDGPDEEVLHTVGRPRPGIDLEIRDDQGERVPDGTVGEVCFRSPAMMRGYWRDDEATAAAIREGWLHTGDLGFIDEAGCLRLAGRAKEMFIRGGYNIYPVAVENVLAEHPGVREVAVVPRPDELMGEIGVAVIVATDPADVPSLDDLRAHASGRLAKHELPEAMRVVDALPLNAMHKLDRRALAAREEGTT